MPHGRYVEVVEGSREVVVVGNGMGRACGEGHEGGRQQVTGRRVTCKLSLRSRQ